MQPLCPGPGNLQMSEVKKKTKRSKWKAFPIVFSLSSESWPLKSWTPCLLQDSFKLLFACLL